MLSRRTLLRGSSLALLPLLHSLLPRTARADAAGPLRFVGMYAPNGIVPALWRPTAFGSSFELPTSLAPLASVRQHVNVVSNLRLGDQDNMGSHEGGQKVFLTASRLAGASSVDQVIGKLSESVVHLPTLNLGIENNGWWWPPQIVANSQGYYEAPNGEDREDRCNGASCVVSVSQGTAQANIYHPQVAFERLFGSAPVPTDGDKLSQTNSGPSVSCDRSTPASPIPVDRDKYAKVMCDLIVRAFQCDATRASTFMLGQGVSPMAFVVDGVSYSHHGDASHHGADAAKTRAKGVIDAWQVSIFAYLVQQLAQVTDVDGAPLLDRAALYYGSDIADGDLHDAVNMPVLLAGKLGGALHPGRHIDGQNKPIGNAFVTILSAFGVTGNFGEFGTAAMEGI